MHRLLAEVRRKTLKRRYRDHNGLDYVRYALRVRVVGSAIDALAVPKRCVGREVDLVRDFLLPWGVKVGDLLVLDPDESARVLCPRRAKDEGCSATSDAARAAYGDFDRDGFSEDLMTNAFVRAIIQPHRGARLHSLKDCDGLDRLAQPFEYIMGGKYILLGGAEEFIAEAGSPGDLWKAAFERKGPTSAGGAVELAYTRALKDPKGVTIGKRVRVEPGLPGVLESYVVSYSGKPRDQAGDDRAGGETGGDGEEPRDGKGGKDDRADLTLCVRLSTPVLGEIGSRNVFDVPGPAELELVRYHRPGYGRRWRWRDWRHEHFGLRAGFLVSRHEEQGAVLAILFSPRKTAHVSIRPDFQGPELTVRHVRTKIAKGRKREFGLALLVGHAVAASADSMLLLTRGKPGRGGVPIAVTLRTTRRVERPRVSMATGGSRKRATLVRRDLPGAGHVYTKVVRLPRAALPLSCAMSVGPERLSLNLEA